MNAGVRFQLPTMVFKANAGIRRIKIRLRNPPRKIYNHKFKGRPTQKKLRHVHVKTAGLKPGRHFVRITVTDVRGKSASRTTRFAICQSTPPFTG